ncbi:MAG: hypothetical protein P9L92_20960 [Candidatus Electryonea clarkiae]|nr:hypothetical protein [Candidatus Electryonea clarkiae]MDP8285681.1 hypothetical protein [Candidatus Electryonea clarkiae]
MHFIIPLFGFYLLLFSGFPGGRWMPLRGAMPGPWISAHPIIGRIAGVCFVIAFLVGESETFSSLLFIFLILGLVLMVTGMIVAASSRK